MNIYRKKHRPVPISFFAFQDIITALAGCMLIFVLALAAAKSRSGGDVPAGKTFARSDYAALQSSIKLKRSILKDQEQKIAGLRAKLEHSEISEQNTLLNKRLKNSTGKLEKISSERARMLEEMQDELSALKNRNRQLKLANKELTALIEQCMMLEKQCSDQRQKLSFADKKNRKNIILTVSRNSWYWQEKPTLKPILAGSSTTALPFVKKQLTGFEPQQTRLIIAVRPSAGGFAGTLKKSLQKTFPAMEIVAEPLSHETLGGLEL